MAEDWKNSGVFDRPALAAMRKSVADGLRLQTVGQVLSRQALRSVFQPIVRLRDARVMAHEALIRGRPTRPCATPTRCSPRLTRRG